MVIPQITKMIPDTRKTDPSDLSSVRTLFVTCSADFQT